MQFLWSSRQIAHNTFSVCCVSCMCICFSSRRQWQLSLAEWVILHDSWKTSSPWCLSCLCAGSSCRCKWRINRWESWPVSECTGSEWLLQAGGQWPMWQFSILGLSEAISRPTDVASNSQSFFVCCALPLFWSVTQISVSSLQRHLCQSFTCDSWHFMVSAAPRHSPVIPAADAVSTDSHVGLAGYGWTDCAGTLYGGTVWTGQYSSKWGKLLFFFFLVLL